MLSTVLMLLLLFIIKGLILLPTFIVWRCTHNFRTITVDVDGELLFHVFNILLCNNIILRVLLMTKAGYFGMMYGSLLPIIYDSSVIMCYCMYLV